MEVVKEKLDTCICQVDSCVNLVYSGLIEQQDIKFSLAKKA